MKFLTWLLSQTNRNDPIGDLARDFKDDSTRPNANSSVEKIRIYLESQSASSEAMVAFKNAVKEWSRQEKE